jgi:hypothetical protein
MNINLMVFKTKEKNMKKNFTQLVIAIGAVTIVAALTGGAVFAFSDGQSKEFLPFLTGSSTQHETPEPPTGTTSVVIKGVITDMTADSISVDGNSFQLDAASDVDAGLTIGSLVEITSQQLPDGTYLAMEVCLENNLPDDSPKVEVTPEDDCSTDDCSDDIGHDCSNDDCSDDVADDCSTDDCSDDINEDIIESNEEMDDINDDISDEISESNHSNSSNSNSSNSNSNHDNSDDHDGESNDDD